MELYTLRFCATVAFVEACGHYWLDQARELRELLIVGAAQYGRDYARLTAPGSNPRFIGDA